MLDHLSIQVKDVAASAAFYEAVLAPLGGKKIVEFDGVVGLGRTQPRFWLGPTTTTGEARELHVAFSAPDRAAVDAFHAAAVAAGAEVLHAPRVWPEYHKTYYGAFVRDLDGNNVEAVCHTPPDVAEDASEPAAGEEPAASEEPVAGEEPTAAEAA